MKIAIYTLTRDRLEYTIDCFNVLWEKAGFQYNHYVVDNGSEDRTPQWLHKHTDKFKHIIFNTKNLGISKASNQALQYILQYPYDLIIKMDNDCMIKSKNILKRIVDLYTKIHDLCILSPRVEGLIYQPYRYEYKYMAGKRIGLTQIIGGLFHIVPYSIYKNCKFPTNLPKAKGQDEYICHWAKICGAKIGYIEELVVEHYEGTRNQQKRYPEYFKRKAMEEKV